MHMHTASAKLKISSVRTSRNNSEAKGGELSCRSDWTQIVAGQFWLARCAAVA